MILITIPPIDTPKTTSMLPGISGSINLCTISVIKKNAVESKKDALKNAPKISNLL